MSLLDKIEKLHKKPDHIKRRILFASLFIVMFTIVAAWVSTLRITLRHNDDNKGKDNQASPIFLFGSIIKDSIVVGAESLGSSINGLKDKHE